MYMSFETDRGLRKENIGTQENPKMKMRIVNKPLFIMFILHIILYVITIIFACTHSYIWLIFSGYWFFFCYPLDILIYKYYIFFRPIKAELVNYVPSSSFTIRSLLSMTIFGTATYRYNYKGADYEVSIQNPLVEQKDIGRIYNIRFCRKHPEIILTSFNLLFTLAMFIIFTMLFITSFDEVSLPFK